MTSLKKVLLVALAVGTLGFAAAVSAEEKTDKERIAPPELNGRQSGQSSEKMPPRPPKDGKNVGKDGERPEPPKDGKQPPSIGSGKDGDRPKPPADGKGRSGKDGQKRPPKPKDGRKPPEKPKDEGSKNS